MKAALALAVLALPLAGAAGAQDLSAFRSFSADLGLGISVGPSYPGSDEAEAGPWLIWRNAHLGSGAATPSQGFSLSPSFGTEGERSAEDDPELAGLNDIDAAYEFGLKAHYITGPVNAYAALRKGFGGHSGLVGEVGAKYRTELSDRVTLWSGVEMGYGDGDYNATYFGVTPAESAASGFPAYAPGGGFNRAAITFEARYALGESTALLGEIQYGKLIGDAGDSPVVRDEYQPLVRVGVVRSFSFGF
ncbi:MipA/OmpV family protein [Paracoccus spongiarum]|uniref:MipA/OmpV family protein n=1 Tax=Paracoccus spongiarum TaxID=3064387 RepID=A0ABT9J754_9RHOB|nr:MipA/OmpV family protein [Paracoccus sp. 2205BS29-5]MDP5305638.1 MipA/OmpV family protein [Paracoccus sp. 2205BS29-5]